MSTPLRTVTSANGDPLAEAIDLTKRLKLPPYPQVLERYHPDRESPTLGPPPKSCGFSSLRKPPAGTGRTCTLAANARVSLPARPSATGTKRNRRFPAPPRTRSAPWSGSGGVNVSASVGLRELASLTSPRHSGRPQSKLGLAVSWFTIEDLGALVRRHRADDSIARALTRIIRSDLIIVDDIGLLPVSEDAAEGFYRLVDAAYETPSDCRLEQPAPLRLRRDHAQNIGHRHR